MRSAKDRFFMLSVDYLKLIAEGSKISSKYPAVAKQVETMQMYYDNLSSLLDNIDDSLAAHRIQSINLHANIKMLSNELEKEMRKGFSKSLKKANKSELKKIRKRYLSGEANIVAKASEHYFLTDEQVKYILS